MWKAEPEGKKGTSRMCDQREVEKGKISVKIKICGLSRPCDIQYVNEAKPDYCGFIVDFPKSHRSVSVSQMEQLLKALSEEVIPVGVFVDTPVERVADCVNRGILTHVQLHGQEDNAYIAELRKLTEEAGKKVTVFQAFKVTDAQTVLRAQNSDADKILLDNGQGTGKTFDWSLLQNVTRPFILAGGLNPENLPEAIDSVHPWAVDLSSGVETERLKDREKILDAVSLVKRYFSE